MHFLLFSFGSDSHRWEGAIEDGAGKDDIDVPFLGGSRRSWRSLGGEGAIFSSLLLTLL